MIEHGNITALNHAHPETRMWFLGPFISPDSPFHHENIEMKWSERLAGEVHHGSISSEPRKTIHIMIAGEGEMIFPSHDMVVPLSSRGSYVVFDTALCTHDFHAITDCTCLVVRFLS